MEYYATLKKVTHAMIWMEFEGSMLSEISQSKVLYHIT